MNHLKQFRALASIGLLAAASQLNADVTVYSNGDQYLKIGGQIQARYYHTERDYGFGPTGYDLTEFSRLGLQLEYGINKQWAAKFQWDMSPTYAGDIHIKDAYLQNKDFFGTRLTIGNMLMPFSRESLTTSRYQALPVNSFVGDKFNGAPERGLGLHLSGSAGKTDWAVSAASVVIEQSSYSFVMGSSANTANFTTEGIMVGGRVQYNIFGNVGYEHGSFSGKNGLALGAAAYHWKNDDDISLYTFFTSSTGYTADLAWRSNGFSVDAQYNRIEADVSPLIGGPVGVYIPGQTTKFDSYSVTAGYMFVPKTWEVVARFSSQDANIGYADAWNRYSLGLNYYVKKHDLKVQLMYRKNDNAYIDQLNPGADFNEVYLQAQLLF